MTATRLGADLGSYVSDPGVWLSWVVLVALLVLGLGVGSLVGLRVGLIHGPSGGVERFGLALGAGVFTGTLAYATVRSGAASAFTPAFVLLVGAIVAGHGRSLVGWRAVPARKAVLAFGVAVGLGLLYGATVSPSARDGMQPLTFMDEAFYAVLGQHLRATGMEDIGALAGLGPIPGVPAQSWYHWGEGWLAALTLEVPGMTAMHARHAVALPLITIATAAIIGGLAARHVPRPMRRQAALIGAFAMVAVAPIPIIVDWHFDLWARAMVFMVTVYGFAFVVAAMGIALLLRPRFLATGPGALLGGSLVAALIASHVLVAAAAAVGVASIAGLQLWAGRATWHPTLRPMIRPAVVGAVAAIATIGWGTWTGHGLVGSNPTFGILPFTEAWVRGIVLSVLGAGVLVAGPAIGIRLGYISGTLRRLASGAFVAAVVAALVWGARVAEFNAYHLYFGTLAVLVTPVAVLLTVIASIRARVDGRVRVAQGLLLVIVLQGALGIGSSISRLYEFSPGHYVDVPTEVLDLIEQLPDDAKLAYACGAFEEVAIWDARLIAITAHTGRPVVPMCYQADLFGPMLRLPPDPGVANAYFDVAPQRELYPTATAKPTPEQLRSFFQQYGIDYLWTDPDHPTALVPDARPLITVGGITVSRIGE